MSNGPPGRFVFRLRVLARDALCGDGKKKIGSVEAGMRELDSGGREARGKGCCVIASRVGWFCLSRLAVCIDFRRDLCE